MAARKNRIRHDHDTRAKIQATQIKNRLEGHIFGRVEMSSTQVRAATALLNKVLPDLQSVTGDFEHRRKISDEAMKPEDWAAEYAGQDERPH